MTKKKSSDFRYNTGETKVPWAAVGENYNAKDLKQVVRFLMQGEGDAYQAAMSAVDQSIDALGKLRLPPENFLWVPMWKPVKEKSMHTWEQIQRCL